LPPEITRPAAGRRGLRPGDAALREHERVVGRGVELDVEDAPQVVQRVADGAVDLGHAAERVRVLDLVRRAVVVGLEARVAEEVAQLRRDGDLAGVRPRQLVRRRVRHVRPEQRLHGHRRRDRGRAGQPVRVREQERPDRAHQLGPVEERQPLLRLEDERLEARLPQGQERRHHVPFELHLAAPDERQGEVGERREVAGRPDAPLLRHDGVDAEGKEVDQPVDELRPAAGVAEGERVRPQEEHRPDDVARERRPDADGVAREEVLLEPAGVCRRDVRGRQVAEAGGDPVDDRALRDEPLHHGAGLGHAGPRVDVERHAGAAATRPPRRRTGRGS
jgi:hypothetical protein